MSEVITKVGAGEYSTAYLTDAGNVYQTNWINGTPQVVKYFSAKGKEVDGGQYHVAITDTDGFAYTLTQGKLVKLNVSNVKKAYGFYTSTVLLYNDGTIGIVGPWMGVTTFNQPPGKVFKKLVTAGTSDGNLTYIYALTTDGSLYRYAKGSSTPTLLVTGVVDVTAVGVFAVVYTTATDIFFLANGYDSRYVGLGYGVKKTTSIKSLFTAKGATFPFKEIVGNYNTLHVIDANDNMFGVGSNPMGEVGNGQGTNYIANQWDWGNGQLLTPVTQIAGKWKNIQTSNNITFYLYVQDLSNNWYSWGRNKAFSLGNRITLSINGYGSYPNYLDVWKPTHVRPLEGTWSVVPFNATSKPTAPVIPLPSAPTPTPEPTVTLSYHNNIVDGLNTQISTLQTTVATLQNDVAQKNTTITSLNNTISTLNAKITAYQNMKTAIQTALDNVV